MQLWERHSSPSSSELWLNATAHLFPTSSCRGNSVWFHLRQNNKDAEVPNGKIPRGRPEAVSSLTAGRILLSAEGRIGLLRVEGASHTCSPWAAIKMQMELWPYAWAIAKVRICLNNRKNWHLKYDNWASDVSVQPKQGEECCREVVADFQLLYSIRFSGFVSVCQMHTATIKIKVGWYKCCSTTYFTIVS